MQPLGLALAVALLHLTGGTLPVAASAYLAAWSGDADREDSDFLAILDVNPDSPRYGRGRPLTGLAFASRSLPLRALGGRG